MSENPAAEPYEPPQDIRYGNDSGINQNQKPVKILLIILYQAPIPQYPFKSSSEYHTIPYLNPQVFFSLRILKIPLTYLRFRHFSSLFRYSLSIHLPLSGHLFPLSVKEIRNSPEDIDPQFQLDHKIVLQVFRTEDDLSALLPSLPAQPEAFPDAKGILPSVSLQDKENPLNQEARNQKRQIQDQLKDRHVLCDQIDRIPGRIPDLEEIVNGAARGASYMKNAGFRLIDIAVAFDPGSPSEVRIFQIGEMILVKQADLIEDFFPVDGCSGTGKKDIRTFPEPLPVMLSLPS